MSCNIVINQQAFLPVSEKVTPEANIKDTERQKSGKKSHEMFTKKLRDNQMGHMISRGFIDYF